MYSVVLQECLHRVLFVMLHVWSCTVVLLQTMHNVASMPPLCAMVD